jgi:hypothetical protein
VLLFLWSCRPEQYARWRSALVGASIAALVVFYAYPVAPPRFVVPDITDTLVVHHIFGTVAQNGTPPTLINDTAAMPSLHVGWALWCAATIVGTTTPRWRHLAWLYPVATTLVVLGTGNHYLLDALGGSAVLAIGMVLTAAPLSSWRADPTSGADSAAPESPPPAATPAESTLPGSTLPDNARVDSVAGSPVAGSTTADSTTADSTTGVDGAAAAGSGLDGGATTVDGSASRSADGSPGSAEGADSDGRRTGAARSASI